MLEYHWWDLTERSMGRSNSIAEWNCRMVYQWLEYAGISILKIQNINGINGLIIWEYQVWLMEKMGFWTSQGVGDSETWRKNWICPDGNVIRSRIRKYILKCAYREYNGGKLGKPSIKNTIPNRGLNWDHRFWDLKGPVGFMGRFSWWVGHDFPYELMIVPRPKLQVFGPSKMPRRALRQETLGCSSSPVRFVTWGWRRTARLLIIGGVPFWWSMPSHYPTGKKSVSSTRDNMG